MKKEKIKSIFRTIISFLFIGVLVFIISFYSFSDTFVVSGDSMNPTLVDGEEGRATSMFGKNAIKRFDVVIAIDRTNNKYIIKRVIGLPGETIEYKNNQLYVNGKLVEETFLSESAANCTCSPNYSMSEGNFCLEPITLANDEFYLLGDNREVSLDSRYFGVVKKADVVSVVIYTVKTEYGKFRFIK